MKANTTPFLFIGDTTQVVPNLVFQDLASWTGQWWTRGLPQKSRHRLGCTGVTARAKRRHSTERAVGLASLSKGQALLIQRKLPPAQVPGSGPICWWGKGGKVLWSDWSERPQTDPWIRACNSGCSLVPFGARLLCGKPNLHKGPHPGSSWFFSTLQFNQWKVLPETHGIFPGGLVPMVANGLTGIPVSGLVKLCSNDSPTSPWNADFSFMALWLAGAVFLRLQIKFK